MLAGPELSTLMLPCTIILHDHQPGPWHQHHDDPTTFNDLTITSSTITNNEECAVIFHRSLLANLQQSGWRQLGDAASCVLNFINKLHDPGSPTFWGCNINIFLTISAERCCVKDIFTSPAAMLSDHSPSCSLRSRPLQSSTKTSTHEPQNKNNERPKLKSSI